MNPQFEELDKLPENAIDIAFIKALHQYDTTELQYQLNLACVRTVASLYGHACDESPLPIPRNVVLAMMDVETKNGHFVLTIEHKDADK